MREIKFRAWIKDEKIMIYPNERNYYVRNDGGLFRIVKLSDKKGQNFLCIETDSELMQYTGLKDKRGKEVYEGDILIAKDRLFKIVVIFSERNGAFIVQNLRPDKCLRDYLEQNPEYELSGNIYENPELLGGEK